MPWMPKAEWWRCDGHPVGKNGKMVVDTGMDVHYGLDSSFPLLVVCSWFHPLLKYVERCWNRTLIGQTHLDTFQWWLCKQLDIPFSAPRCAVLRTEQASSRTGGAMEHGAMMSHGTDDVVICCAPPLTALLCCPPSCHQFQFSFSLCKASKAFSKDFFAKYKLPTASYRQSHRSSFVSG